jgi:hypothetical protein
MAAYPKRLSLDGDKLEFSRSGTFLEKLVSGVLFIAGAFLLSLNGDGEWGKLTGFHQHWAGVALALYLLMAPLWSFMSQRVVVERSQPKIDCSSGWSIFRLHRGIKREAFNSISVVSHDRAGFFQGEKLSHSIVIFGHHRTLFLYRTKDYPRAVDLARKLSLWMHLRFVEARTVTWKPFSWIYYYNSVMLMILCGLAIWDWLS